MSTACRLRVGLVVLGVYGAPALADEPTPETSEATWSALRIHVECQQQERVAACDYIRGSIAASELLVSVPRSDDQVTLYVNVTTQANDDLVNLRFASELPEAPATYVLTEIVDSRADAEEQREQLEQAFLQGDAVYLALAVPGSVRVELEVPSEASESSPKTTPFGMGLYCGGWGRWSENYQSASGWAGIYGYRLTNRDKIGLEVHTWYDYERQPSLEVDGAEVALVSSSYGVNGKIGGAHNLGEHFAVGGMLRGGRDDPEGQFQATLRAHGGVSWDLFPSDDPRGNQLAVAYLVGVQADRYNRTNVLGEDQAVFPTHMLLATGEVRFDTVELSADVGVQAQLNAHLRRHELRARGHVEVAVGDHLDVFLRAGITRRAIPGPLDIDSSSYEEVTRTGYAEPLELDGNVNLHFHWDHTNGARNNRFEVVNDLNGTSNL